MPVIESRFDAATPESLTNAGAMRAVVADLRAQAARIEAGGGAAARERHTARGKMLPRERVRLLLDPLSPFLEIGQLAAHGMYEDAVPSAGADRGDRAHQWACVHGHRQ